MAQVNNYLDVLKLLPQTNCKDCKQPTCMVFAVKVMQGNLTLADCPHLSRDVVQASQVQASLTDKVAQDAEEFMAAVREKLAKVDFAASQQRLGATLQGDKLAVTMLGKDFVVDHSGNMTSKCHNNMWVLVPLFSYIVNCQGKEPLGKWVPLRDLPGGLDWGRFFEHRCEIPMKKVIDEHTEMFELMIDVFGAKPTEAFDSDIAMVLHPLPKVPMLVCYWKAEEGMESDLNLFWDVTATDNIGIDALYNIGAGMTVMFEKVALTHGL